MAHTPSLWKHITLPIALSLVINNFGVKYVDRDNADHLIASRKHEYQISEDLTGALYFGITLEWNYENDQTKRYVDIIPGYINNKFKKYKHEISKPPNIYHI